MKTYYQHKNNRIGNKAKQLFPLCGGFAPHSLLLLTLLLISLTACQTEAELAVTLTMLSNSSVNQYGLAEFSIDSTIEVENPFVLADAPLRLNLTSPTGETTTIGAFWYQDYQGEQKVGDPTWRARFTPTESGTWTAQATWGAVNSEPVTFEVMASEHPGFIQVHPENPRYLAYEDGTPLLIIGTNMSWWQDDPLADYERWLDSFAENGGNTIRVWMASWAYGLEWQDTGLGDYRQRMYQAWLLDELFRMTEARDINIILVLINHGAFSEDVNPEWAENPYNAELGGPLAQPGEFATNAEARQLFKRRLTYIANRWSYAPNLMAWEWWNEVNFTPITEADLSLWLVEMSAHLQQYDPNDHLMTISYAAGGRSEVWQLPEIDIVQKHEYNTRDMQISAPRTFKELSKQVPLKPIVFTEFGYSAGGEDTTSIDQEGVHLHNGLWAGVFSGYGGTGMYWWWDTYIDPLALWSHFKGISHFMTDVDITKYQPMHPLKVDGEGSPQAVGLALQKSDGALVWVRSSDYTAKAILSSYQDAIRDGKEAQFKFNPAIVTHQTILLNDLSPGTYHVEWFDPQTATWLNSATIEAVDGRLRLPIPNFERDLAVKVSLVVG